MGGKRDWAGGGLPIEGRKAQEPRIGSLARRDVPTARLGDKVGDIARSAEGRGYDLAVVVTPDGVVLGILDPEALVVSSSAKVEDVMRPGPATFRPDVPVQELLEKLAPKHVRRALVATPEGRLLGVFSTDDVAP
ncbi:MAG TPA: CBS domain-containing protein [Actinomycetota bacterium]